MKIDLLSEQTVRVAVPNFVVLLIGRLWYKRNDLIRGGNLSSGLAKGQRLLGTSRDG